MTDRTALPIGPWAALGLVLLVTAARLVVNGGLDPLPLSGDEAQYWIYGEHLAGGYYSKPPLLPWLMRFSTELFGHHPWAMRLPSVLLHLATGLCLLALGRRLFGRGVGVLAAAVYLTLPAVTVSSMVASTDPPMLFGWALATLALIEALRAERPAYGWWALAGFAVGLGLLGKYTMVAWVLPVAALLAFDPHWRRGVRAGGVAVAVLAALVTVSPNLVWNVQNGFPTLSHLGENADLAAGTDRTLADRWTEVAEFLLGQIGVFGPIATAVLLALAVRPATWRDPAMRLVLALGLPLLIAITVQAWLFRANANWAAPAYLGFTLAVAAVLMRQHRRRVARWLLAFNVVVMVLIVGVAEANRAEPLAWSKFWDPFQLLRGTNRIGDEVGAFLAAEPDRYLVMANRMLLANVLERTGWPLERSVMWNWDGRVSNHFEMVTALPNDPSARFLVVTTRGEEIGILPRFEHVELALQAPIRTHADREIVLTIHRVEGLRPAP